MASSVTAPLERQFGQMPGLKQMTSTSSFGSSVITLQFALDAQDRHRGAGGAGRDQRRGTLLPRDLPNPPVYSKVNPADAPVLTLALTSKTLPLSQVQSSPTRAWRQRFRSARGRAGDDQRRTEAGGAHPGQPDGARGRHRACRILQHGDAAANVNQAKGTFDGPHRPTPSAPTTNSLRATHTVRSIVAYSNGAPVRLSDVAEVVDSAEELAQAAWMNTTPAVILNVQRQPGANTSTVVDRIKALLPQLTATLPPAVEVTVLTDRTTTIRASVQDVQFELMLTVALVVLVIFLFLRKLSRAP